MIARRAEETTYGVVMYEPTPANPYYRLAWTTYRGERKYATAGRDHDVAWAKACHIDDMLAVQGDTRTGRTVAQLAKAWTADLSRAWSPRHTFNQRDHVKRWVLPAYGELPVEVLTRDDVRDILDTPTARSGRRHLRAAVGGMLGWGYDNGWLDQTRDALMPKQPRTAKSRTGKVGESRLHIDAGLIPSPADCKALADAARAVGGEAHGQQYWLMVAVAASTGVRQGELFALRPSDIDWAAHELRVERQVSRVTGQKLAETPPKWGRTRKTVLPDKTLWSEPLAGPLAAYMADLKPNGLLFPSPRGEWMSGPNFGRRVLKPARAAAGWPAGWTLHSARHSFCSALIAKGMAPQDVARAAGHASSSTTLDMYVSSTAGAMGRLNDAFS